MFSPQVIVKKAATDIERKLWGGGATAVTATSVTAALAYFGIHAPGWVPPIVAIVFYFVGGYFTRSTANATEPASVAAATVGSDLSDGKLDDTSGLYTALEESFAALNTPKTESEGK